MSDHHHRLAWTGIIAAVVLAGALLALNFPVFLESYDQYGFQIKCGTGYLSDLAQAAAATGGDYVDQCETALLTRRLWTIPLALAGGAALLLALVASATASARQSLQAAHHHDA